MDYALLSRKKIPWIIAILLLFFGGVMIIINPPLNAPDENTHFYNAFALADGQLGRDVVKGSAGRYIPTAITDFITNYNSRDYSKIPFSYSEMVFLSMLPRNMNDAAFIDYWGNEANLAQYTVPALGILFGRAILPSYYETPYNLLLFGRFAVLLFYIISVSVTLRIIPRYRSTIILLAFLPMSMFLASSLSYDVVIISCAMLLFALLLRFYEHDSISKWEMSLLAFVAFNLMICKSSFYATLLLILLPFLTKNRKRCIKQILLLVTTLIIGALTKLMFHYLSSATTDAIISSTNQILQAQQKTYLLGNVDQLIPIVLNTVKSSYRFWYISMTGCLGNLNINIVIPFLFLYTLSIFGSAVCEGFNYPYRLKWEKLATVLILLIEISALIIYMYLQWTPLVSELYGDISTGVQGRYFIPFLPFLLLIFANRFSFKRVKRLQGYVPLLSIGIGSLMAVISIIVVFLKCYIPL